MKFAELGLAEPILRAVEAEGYETTTPIQGRAIPPVMQGRDVLGCAQTGTGKTAAFALPVLHQLFTAGKPQGTRRPRCLVLSPTRELALQIGESFATYGKNLPLRHVTIFGGVSQRPQVSALRRGVDILIATPGRLMDLYEQGFVDLEGVDRLILDEADRMLDMGFINDIKKIIAKMPAREQTLLFSATIPPAIRSLADGLLRNPVKVEVAPESTTAERIEQGVYFVERSNKTKLLSHLLERLSLSRAIVFTRTKHGADRVVKHLKRAGLVAEAIHGNKSQNARQRTLANFRDGRVPVLVATDVASRGIDVDNVSHVINYDLTHEPESYVHRIGRTARAGASGRAISFCDRDEFAQLEAIERLIRQPLAECTDYADEENILLPRPASKRRSSSNKPQRPGNKPAGGRGPKPQASQGGAAGGNGRNKRRRPRRGPGKRADHPMAKGNAPR